MIFGGGFQRVVETKQVLDQYICHKYWKSSSGGDKFTSSGDVPYFYKRIPDCDPGLTREYSGLQEVDIR